MSSKPNSAEVKFPFIAVKFLLFFLLPGWLRCLLLSKGEDKRRHNSLTTLRQCCPCRRALFVPCDCAQCAMRWRGGAIQPRHDARAAESPPPSSDVLLFLVAAHGISVAFVSPRRTLLTSSLPPLSITTTPPQSPLSSPFQNSPPWDADRRST